VPEPHRDLSRNDREDDHGEESEVEDQEVEEDESQEGQEDQEDEEDGCGAQEKARGRKEERPQEACGEEGQSQGEGKSQAEGEAQGQGAEAYAGACAEAHGGARAEADVGARAQADVGARTEAYAGARAPTHGGTDSSPCCSAASGTDAATGATSRHAFGHSQPGGTDAPIANPDGWHAGRRPSARQRRRPRRLLAGRVPGKNSGPAPRCGTCSTAIGFAGSACSGPGPNQAASIG
jgi:hypothetical protein